MRCPAWSHGANPIGVLGGPTLFPQTFDVLENLPMKLVKNCFRHRLILRREIPYIPGACVQRILPLTAQDDFLYFHGPLQLDTSLSKGTLSWPLGLDQTFHLLLAPHISFCYHRPAHRSWQTLRAAL
jgi:hypothetical protein